MAGSTPGSAAAEDPADGAGEEEGAQDVFVPWALQPAPVKKVREPRPVPLSKGAKVPYTGPRNTEGKKKRKQLAKEAEARLLAGGGAEEAGSSVGGSEAGDGGGDGTASSGVPDVTPLSLDATLPAPAEQPPAEDAAPMATAPAPAPASAPAQPTFHRYYHLFRHGELSALAVRAARELGAAMVDRSDDQIARLGAEVEEANAAADKGWVREVELKCESWERENWAAQIGVNWVWRE